MKKAILIFCITVLGILPGVNYASGSGDDNGWTLTKSAGKVDLFYKIGQCNGETVIFLKFDNKNDKSVTISWKEAVTDVKFGKTFEGQYGAKQLVLKPGITSSDNCSEASIGECVVRMTEIVPTFPAEPKSFEFKEVTVSKSSR